MKNKEAIARTRARLRQEYEDRKAKKLSGLRRHQSELEDKISRLQDELAKVNSKITQIEGESFRDPIPSEDQRREQSELSKQIRL